MKKINGTARTKTAEWLESTAKVRTGQWLTLAAPFVLSMVAAGPAEAACVQSGSTVTCSGASVTGFGTGAENNLTLTVQSGGSITAVNDVNLGTGNAVTSSSAVVSASRGSATTSSPMPA